MGNKFLPITIEDMNQRGWDSCDFIIITGDAYIDHPSFGSALIGRLLEAEGYRVGIISQPQWNSLSDFQVLGAPKLAWMITAGTIDSMVSHYTSTGAPRSQDAYTPGGVAGKRPDRATITYANRARQAFPGVPIIIAGIEASLRRLAHYDYWSDKVRKSILLDAKADLLIYGMGERATLEIARRLQAQEPIHSLTNIRGTVFPLTKKTLDSFINNDMEWGSIQLPSFEEISDRDPASNQPTESGRNAYARSIAQRFMHENPMLPARLIESSGDIAAVQNPPALPLDSHMLDAIYELPYTRNYHPIYEPFGGVPALKEVQFSLVTNRGCYGGCTFCAITSHQGRMIQTRSIESLVRETKTLTAHPDFKGYIHDAGGPTANFQGPACYGQEKRGPCDGKQCLFPTPCGALQDTHDLYLAMLHKIETVPGVKKVFIRSGIRYDYLLTTATPDTLNRFMKKLCRDHISGQLKVAPEHVSERVLDYMGKPSIQLYLDFMKRFTDTNKQLGKKQYMIPYFISGHPGSQLEDAIALAEFLKTQQSIPDQVQDFYPTPGSLATCMYYTGLDPRPGRNFASVYIPKGREKKLQRALLHFHKPENYALVREALIQANRTDLIGNGAYCLIPAASGGKSMHKKGSSKPTGKPSTPKKFSEKSKKTSSGKRKR